MHTHTSQCAEQSNTSHTLTHTASVLFPILQTHMNKVSSTDIRTHALNLSLTPGCVHTTTQTHTHKKLYLYNHCKCAYTSAPEPCTNTHRGHILQHTPILNFWDLRVKSWLDVMGSVQTRQNCSSADGWWELAAAVRSLSETVTALFILQALPLPTSTLHAASPHRSLSNLKLIFNVGHRSTPSICSATVPL